MSPIRLSNDVPAGTPTRRSFGPWWASTSVPQLSVLQARVLLAPVADDADSANALDDTVTATTTGATRQYRARRESAARSFTTMATRAHLTYATAPVRSGDDPHGSVLKEHDRGTH